MTTQKGAQSNGKCTGDSFQRSGCDRPGRQPRRRAGRRPAARPGDRRHMVGGRSDRHRASRRAARRADHHRPAGRQHPPGGSGGARPEHRSGRPAGGRERSDPGSLGVRRWAGRGAVGAGAGPARPQRPGDVGHRQRAGRKLAHARRGTDRSLFADRRSDVSWLFRRPAGRRVRAGDRPEHLGATARRQREHPGSDGARCGRHAARPRPRPARLSGCRRAAGPPARGAGRADRAGNRPADRVG